ncbi:septal ring lytic transglycosylase RlpA family protein [Aestuariispira insulae]|uniref:Endolytic peptidoglycan transglycosylase RlpA n=1 Tax=Aestuariispira insulae TaxID=1461337 RepID=A0A3D9HP41_9PROT|nr:septal ring lytic transglycosylase RlpA family protein [Aestuariispira insulae]RED51081.1 rare lipoprotein A [Aestuariispira insulae]
MNTKFLGMAALSVFMLTGCSEIQFLSQASKEISPADASDIQHRDGSGGNGKRYKVGNAYQIKGNWYYPKEDYAYVETGIASWYGPNFHGKQTANGAIFDMNKVSAAHRTLPMPSMVRVTNLENGRSLKVKVNDRGPYAHNRIIDLSKRAAELLGFKIKGTALVKVEVLEAESRQLVAIMNGETLDHPPAPAASPSIVVQAEPLEAPVGTVDSKPSSTNHDVQVASSSNLPVSVESETLGEPVSDEQVTVVSVAAPPQIYIQAGAFSQYSNAVITKARLSSVGPTIIQQINKADRPLFRVRIGPFDKVEEADRLQEAITEAGYPDARIIVDD